MHSSIKMFIPWIFTGLAIILSPASKFLKGSENGWAAAVEYYIKKDAGEAITQAEVSEKYEISPRTLGKRYKELRIS